MQEGMERVTWVFRAVDAIASNAARVPMVMRRDDSKTGEEVTDHPLYPIYNSKANVGEDSFVFRYRLSTQLLLSKRGVFVEVVRNNGGEVSALVLLPPDQVEPIPHPKNFVSGYELKMPNERPKKLKAEDVVWIRKPHPFDPYKAITPMEAAGLAIETDFLAKIYNRNFMVNDGRPGGLVVVKGEMTEDDKEELRSRFRGSVQSAGRVSVIASEDGADYVDTAITPRDAQYSDTRKQMKEEILIAFGVPESVLANAAGRTFDNADQERLIFWMETMIPHLELIARPLDVLDGDEKVLTAHDTSGIDVIQRAEIRRREFLLKEVDSGAACADEYRVETGRKEIEDGSGKRIYMPRAKIAVGTVDGSILPPDPLAKPVGRPPSTDTDLPDNVADQGTAAGDKPVALAAQHPAGSSLRLLSAEEEEPEVETASIEEVVTPMIKIGDFEIPEQSFIDFKAATEKAYDRWDTIVERTMVRYFERQQRVVLDKLQSQKMRRIVQKFEQWTDSAKVRAAEEKKDWRMFEPPGNLSYKVLVDTIYDEKVWNDQLAEDMDPLLGGIISEFGEEVQEQIGGEFAMDNPKVIERRSIHLQTLLLVNLTTKRYIERALYDGLVSAQTVDDMAENMRGIFEKAIEDRSRIIAINQTVAAAGLGKYMAAILADGAKKTWVTMEDKRVRETHVEVNGTTEEIYEKFSVGGGMLYPGDPAGGAEEVVNCRCTLLIATNSGLVLAA